MSKYNIYKLNNYDSNNCTRFLEDNDCFEFIDFKRKKCFDYYSNYTSMNHEEYDIVIMNDKTNNKIIEFLNRYNLDYSISYAWTSKNILDTKHWNRTHS